MMDFLQLKRPDLVAQEQTWQKQYQARQAQMMAPPPSMTTKVTPTATASPSGPAKVSTPSAVQVVPTGAPDVSTVVSTKSSAPAKKPAQ